MPFTYLRAYATELCTTRPDGRIEAGTGRRTGGPTVDRPAGGGLPRLPAVAPRDAADVAIDRQARCRDQRASLTRLFFSEDLMELARARAICSIVPGARRRASIGPSSARSRTASGAARC